MIKKYLRLCKENNKYLYIFTFALIMIGIFEIIIPIFASKIIDYLEAKELNKIVISITLLFLSYIVLNLSSLLAKKTYTKFFKNNFIRLHKKVIDKIYNLSGDSLSKLSKGKIINTVNIDIINISDIPDYFLDTLYMLSVMIVMIIIFIKTNIIIGLITLLVSIIYLYIGNKLTKKSNYYFKGQRKYTDRLINLLGETISGLKDIKTLNIETNLNKKYDYEKRGWANNYVLKRKYVIRYQVHLKWMIYLFKIILYISLSYLLFKNNITIGLIVLVISYYDQIIGYCQKSIEDVSNLRDYIVSLNRIYELLEFNTLDNIIYGNVNNDYIDGIVEFKNVYFKYKDIPTIKNISFKAYPNQMTVIAGVTGSGKTTIFNLLLKLYNPDKGSIYIDNLNINEYSKEVYRSNVSVVNQESFMFNMSIKENLSLVDNDVNNQIEACKRVGIHDFIVSLPNGYNTILKENASNISGGQKRLLSLAKTLLSNSEILLFDEVTSSLDPKTTNHIIKVLKGLLKDHTVIVITHKKELMKAADKLIILNNGKIVSIGTYNSLSGDKNFKKLLK
ncbi:MAG: ABC transporter ATP-binding protein [Bacilli bacterium]|nr:ABC transporter ATP-binding protein [Bacilli bacterium]